MNTTPTFQPIESATGSRFPVHLPPLSTPRASLPRASFANIIEGSWEAPVEAPRVRINDRHIRHRLLLMQEFDLIPDPNTQLLRAKVAADRLWWRMICDRTSDPVLAAYIARAISYDRPEPRATGPTHQSRPLPPIPIQPIAQPRRVHVGDEAHVARQKPVERRGLRWGDGITAMDLLRSLEEGVPCDFKPRSVETAVPEPSNAHIEAERARTLLQMLMTPPEPQAGVPIHRGRFASQRNARGRGDDYHAAYYAPLAAH